MVKKTMRKSGRVQRWCGYQEYTSYFSCFLMVWTRWRKGEISYVFFTDVVKFNRGFRVLWVVVAVGFMTAGPHQVLEVYEAGLGQVSSNKVQRQHLDFGETKCRFLECFAWSSVGFCLVMKNDDGDVCKLENDKTWFSHEDGHRVLLWKVLSSISL
ncbi:unnamed protein product [Vicia faba]|uniref:Uncharacterized protein n=1 Tax=Vicia faba TaxID=3906 RepID=A0AAV1AZQ6_VICFA|nr:unnamed protein product [Vicia faba]